MDQTRRTILKEGLQLAGYASLVPLLEGRIGSLLSVSAVVEALLPQWETQVQNFWELYHKDGVAAVEPFFPLCVSQLAVAAKQPAKQQKKVAGLASQAYQLQWLLDLQHQNFGQAAISAKQAFLYGEIAEDTNLLLASLLLEVHIFDHLKNPAKQLELHEQALQYASEAIPLLQSWLYLSQAGTYAYLGERKAAHCSLDLARDRFFKDPKQDPIFSHYALNASWFANHEVTTHLNLQQPKVALVALDQFDKTIGSLAPQRVLMANNLLTTYCVLNEMDAACETFVIAEQGARASGSRLRYNEISNAYFEMVACWPREKKVVKLKELLR